MAEGGRVSASESPPWQPLKKVRLRIRSDAPCPKHEDRNGSTTCWCGFDDSPDSETEVFGCYPTKTSLGTFDNDFYNEGLSSAMAGSSVERPLKTTSVREKVDGQNTADTAVAQTGESASVKDTADLRGLNATTSSEISTSHTGKHSEHMVFVQGRVHDGDVRSR